MKKQIDAAVREKLDQIKPKIQDIPNTVPDEMRRTFNFKGRKSPGVAEKVIETVCNKETVLYDPFMGSGSFVFAAMNQVGTIYATELDNYTFGAVRALFTKADLSRLDALFEQVKKDCYAKIMSLYETRCCGRKNYISKVLFDPAEGKEGYFHPSPNREIRDGKNVKLLRKCPVCGKRAKQFDDSDYAKIEELSEINADRFPRARYIVNSRINITASTGADRYDRIFTHRNKIALLLLQDSVRKLDAGPERDILEQALVSALSLARIAMYDSSTDILYHVVRHRAQEMNVWVLFEEKYRNFRTFKQEYSSCQIGACSAEVKMYNQDYASFIDAHPDLRADVIYTDFPYTDQVPYLERNQLYRIWLETFYDSRYRLTREMLEKEIVLTDAEGRPEKNSLDNYYKDIDNMFAHFSKVLKEKGLVFFTMKLGRAKYFKTYIEIVNLARKNGFEYAYQTDLVKTDPTIRKQAAFTNTFMNEIIAVFYKLDEKDRYWYIGNDNYEFLLVKKVYFYLLNAKDCVTLSGAVKLVCEDLRIRYQHLASGSEIEKIRLLLLEYFSVDAGVIQISDNRLYLDIEDSDALYTKIYDLMPVFIRRLLDQKGKFVLEDICFELVNALCDGNPKTIIQILEEESHQSEIERLILNYCVIEDKYYVERKDILKPNEDAVDISTLTGTEFEELIVRLLKAEGYENVVRIGGAGDLGVDILACRQENGRVCRELFQCKRWVHNVGSEPVQRLYAERKRRGFDKAACVTTSGYTKDGKTVAGDLDVGITDGTELMKKLNKYFPGQYYNGSRSV